MQAECLAHWKQTESRLAEEGRVANGTPAAAAAVPRPPGLLAVYTRGPRAPALSSKCFANEHN